MIYFYLWTHKQTFLALEYGDIYIFVFSLLQACTLLCYVSIFLHILRLSTPKIVAALSLKISFYCNYYMYSNTTTHSHAHPHTLWLYTHAKKYCTMIHKTETKFGLKLWNLKNSEKLAKSTKNYSKIWSRFENWPPW